MHVEERHGDVTLRPEPQDSSTYARATWAVVIDGVQRGRVVRPNGLGAKYEAWSMHERPHAKATPGKTGLLGTSAQVDPAAAREELAGRFLAAHGRGKVPSVDELAASGWRRPGRGAPRRASREPTMRQALGGIRVSEPAQPRVDEDGKPLPGIGYIP